MEEETQEIQGVTGYIKELQDSVAMVETKVLGGAQGRQI